MTKIKVFFTLVILLASFMILKGEKSYAESEKFNMSFLYGSDSNGYLDEIEKTQNSLDMVSPSYFDINEDGSLKIVNLDENFIRKIKDKDIEVMPFLSNHWNRELGRRALKNKGALATELAQAINRYNLDGLIVDIENLTEQDRSEYVEFVKVLRSKLPKKDIAVAVGANAKGTKVGWHGSYDYKALSNYSDYLIIMGYDESSGSLVAKAGSSYGFVENSIKHVLNSGVKSQKLVLSVPFYGRYWSDRDENFKANSIRLTETKDIIEKFNPQINYDKKTESPWFRFIIKENSPKTVIGWKTLTPGNYTVWFENNKSIKAKLDLVTRYNLKGAGSWRLGQENPDIWNYYTLWLNNQYFSDIVDHWAEEDIVYNINKGWMIGMSDKEFSPNGNLTRAQASVVISKFLDLDINKYNSDKPFTDVDPTHWGFKYIKAIKEENIISGFEDGNFKPDDTMTREQLASVIDRMLKVDGDINNYEDYYSDVKKGRWSYESILKLTKLDILKGVGNNKFEPTRRISRAEMAAVMYRVDTSPYL